MSWSKSVTLKLLAVGAIVFLTGCPAKGPKVYPVSGKVTIGGQPAKDVIVNFQPTNPGKDMPSASARVENGSYELLSGSEGKKGAAAGTYKVYLTVDPTAANSMEKMKERMSQGAGAPPAEAPPPFKAEFGDPTKTPLTFDVKTSSNTYDIAADANTP